MTNASRFRSGTCRVVFAAVATAALLASAGVAAATGAPTPTPTHSLKQGPIGTLSAVPAAGERAAVTPLPPCTGQLYRTANGKLDRYTFVGDRFSRTSLGTISFGGVVETPKTLTFVKQDGTRSVFMAVRKNGSLWRITWDGAAVATTQLSASGWSGIRNITASPTGTLVYALTDAGLYRYSVTSSMSLRGLGAIATSGWEGARYLSPLPSDGTRDAFIGVSHYGDGDLTKYVIDRSTGEWEQWSLSAGRWYMIRHVSVGVCEGSRGVTLIGVANTDKTYGYYDPNGYDFSGVGMTTSGQNGFGFSGLIND